ncbi:hypothetical protein KI387_000411 [Taxus chinensis]|uniref:Disease resistance R13L4/SHOC-2-like LRR domain-containing protein n=1 Tax=Taxus chinensis TaxID=29808 RepID=A0AA38GU20_TAXCH|nr:hypothetical protein KI387_000411 [Taxus chinensis]
MANLCLVEVWEELWRGNNELKKYCRVHDLLHDFAMYICKENKCAFDAQHAFTKGSSPERSGDWYRILLPKKNIPDDVMAHSRPAGSGPRLLHTLSLYGNDINNIPANMFLNMRALRVLDLSSNNISTMPDCVGEMKLLKVLNISNTGLGVVPKCVRRLKSLRFLDASGSKLPGISKFSSLRVLRSSSALRIPFQNDECLSLEDVSNMINLQEIGIRFDDESQWKSIEGGILGHLVKMQHFTLFNSMQMGSDLPVFPENLKAMADLEKLEIAYFAVTSCLCSFANLRELRLISCQWSNYPEFEKLPNLVSFYLNGNVGCTELPKAFGKSSGFPKLRFLAINYFYQLEAFPELEDGAMPCLELIILWGCDELKKVPEGLELLKSLKEFSYFNTGTSELRERLKEGGQDWNIIKARNPHMIIRG